jgi:hypothetical protein
LSQGYDVVQLIRSYSNTVRIIFWFRCGTSEPFVEWFFCCVVSGPFVISEFFNPAMIMLIFMVCSIIICLHGACVTETLTAPIVWG